MTQENQNEIPQFDDAQKAYVQKILAEEGKVLKLGAELLTHEQRADQAHEVGDIDALKDPSIRAAYLKKFGVDEFGRLHLRATREKREKQRLAEQQQLLERSKARQGRRVF